MREYHDKIKLRISGSMAILRMAPINIVITKDNEANYQKKYRKIALELIDILKENGK